MTTPKSPIKTLRRRATGSRADRAVTGVVLGRDWFPRNSHLNLYDSYYVVAKWHEYSDGRRITAENRTSISICRDLDLAKTIYNNSLRYS